MGWDFREMSFTSQLAHSTQKFKNSDEDGQDGSVGTRTHVVERTDSCKLSSDYESRVCETFNGAQPEPSFTAVLP